MFATLLTCAVTCLAASAQQPPDFPGHFQQWAHDRVGPVVFPEGSSHSWEELTHIAADLGTNAVKTWVGAEKPGDALARVQSEPYRELIRRFRVVHFNISPAYIADRYASGVIHPDSLRALRDEWSAITRFLCRERTSKDQIFLLSVGGEINVYLGTTGTYPDFPVAEYVNACHSAKEAAIAKFGDADRPRVYSVAEIQGDKEFERFTRQWAPQFGTDLISLSYYTFYVPVEKSLALLESCVKPKGPFGAHRLMLGEYGPSMESCNWNQAAQARWHDEILRQAFKQQCQFAFFYEIADHETVISTGSHDGLVRWTPEPKHRLDWAYYADLYHGRKPVLPEEDVYEERASEAPSDNASLPNLTLSDLNVDKDQASLNVRVANAGNIAAPATTVNFFVDDRLISWVWLPGLEPGNSTTINSAQQDPRFVWKPQKGRHRVAAVVDPLNRIQERDKADNIARSEVDY